MNSSFPVSQFTSGLCRRSHGIPNTKSYFPNGVISISKTSLCSLMLRVCFPVSWVIPLLRTSPWSPSTGRTSSFGTGRRPSRCAHAGFMKIPVHPESINTDTVSCRICALSFRCAPHSVADRWCCVSSVSSPVRRLSAVFLGDSWGVSRIVEGVPGRLLAFPGYVAGLPRTSLVPRGATHCSSDPSF